MLLPLKHRERFLARGFPTLDWISSLGFIELDALLHGSKHLAAPFISGKFDNETLSV
jgi:hypothetical protein